LIAENPEIYHSPAYVARYGWVGIYLDGPTLPLDEIAGLIADAAAGVAARRRKG
jgi:hypothetical protein